MIPEVKLSASRRYWELKKIDYPFRLEVDHMSAQDLDPKYYSRLSRGHFLRVPFDGKAHWGFRTHEEMVHFQNVAGIVS